MDLNRIDSMKVQQTTKPVVKKTEAKDTAPAAPKDQVELGKESAVNAVKPHKKWLFINYVAADCNLTKLQLANLDQQENVGSDANTHIVAYVDVGPEPAPMKDATPNLQTQATPEQPDPPNWSGARTLYITKDNEPNKLNSEVIEEHGKNVDMSSPETLKKFVIDAVKKFPAANVALILNDHGGGHTGAMADDHDGDFMSMPGMRKALSEAQEETGKKLDIIGFDACVMAETEVAYSLKDVGNILLASEENEGGPGWTYDDGMLRQNRAFSLSGPVLNQAIKEVQGNLHKIDVSPYDFAKRVVEINEKHQEDIPTFSATDLTQMDTLKKSTDGLAKAILKTEDKQAVRDSINAAENYGGGWAPYRDMRDLHHLSKNIIAKSSDEKLKNAAGDVKKAVEKVVFANQSHPTEHPNSRGLSIYAPTSGSMGNEYKELIFAKDSQWDEAIESLGVQHDPNKKGPTRWPDGTPRPQKD